MYKTHTAADYKKLIGLPEDYRVDALVIYGTWNRDKQIKILKEVIAKSEIEVEYNILPGFLESVLELKTKTIWFFVSYGGALLSEILHLACLFGSTKNFLLGHCGGLYPDINSGDFIIPTSSYGNESTTRMYQPDVIDYEFGSDTELSEKLAQLINKDLPSESKLYQVNQNYTKPKL